MSRFKPGQGGYLILLCSLLALLVVRPILDEVAGSIWLLPMFVTLVLLASVWAVARRRNQVLILTLKVQLYVSFEGSQVERPIKLLKGFERVTVPAGQTRVVQLRVRREDLAWYDSIAGAWRVEDIRYRALVGGSR